MAQALTVKINKKFQNIDVIDKSSLKEELDQMQLRKTSLEEKREDAALKHQRLISELEKEKEQLKNLASAMSTAISEMDKIHQYAIAQHKQEIVRLSVEIARKIMLKQIELKDYNIADIIEKTLERSPDRQNILIFVSPDDYEFCSNFIKENENHPIAKLNINSSPTVSNGQCKVDTSKGIIEYFIDEHLARISDALGASL